MKKEELYSPEKTGSFQMMFGFKQPDVYRYVPVVRQPRKDKKWKLNYKCYI